MLAFGTPREVLTEAHVAAAFQVEVHVDLDAQPPIILPSEFAMVLKLSKNLDEVCYPFIQDTSYLCDFEVVTDELCALIGGALAYLPDDMPDLRADLEQLQPLAFHVNGSVRGRLAVEEADIAWLSARLAHYRRKWRND